MPNLTTTEPRPGARRAHGRSLDTPEGNGTERLQIGKRGNSSSVLISGALLSATAVAVLARCLQRAGQLRLADDVGLALDADWAEFTLAPNEEKTILSVLRDCPELLRPLRDVLQASIRRRGENLA